MSLPAVIPLFPLPNAVLFPGVPLPLHVFEPRYRDMVRDAAERQDRMIGMVLLRGDWRERYLDRPEIFTVGCAGRMVRCDLLEDGRYNILLQGAREFSIRAEVGATSYRQAEVTWREPPADGLDGGERGRIRGLAGRYLESRDPGFAERLLSEAAGGEMSDEMLVNVLSFSLDFPPLEKQALLEAAAVRDRTARLGEMLEFGLGGGGFEGAGSLH